MVRLVLVLLFTAGLTGVSFADRDVQIRSIDFVDEIMEIHNFGDDDVDLDGWRFCSHDSNQLRVYSSSSGLDDITIEAGTSIFIYFDNDAPTDDDDAIDRSDVGSFATPLDNDAYGIQLYFPGASGSVSFGTSSTIADHIQWNDDGSAGSSENRTGQAVSEDLWSATGDFIETTEDTLQIVLDDESGGTDHGPDDYSVINPPPLERSVQIRSVDFETGIMELYNYSDEDIDLDNWRFCSHDGDEDREYTSANALDGFTIEAGTSIFIHFDNDADEDNEDQVDRSDLGNFALPLESTAYAIQLYFPSSSGTVSFSNSDLIADHVQWKEDLAAEGTAEFRTDQAVDVGLWTAEGDWIATDTDTVTIRRKDDATEEPHGPDSYDTFECSSPFVRGDSDDDTLIELGDVIDMLAFLFSGGPEIAPRSRYDVNNDGVEDIVDPIVLLVYIFLDGADPDQPFPERGCE